MTKCANCYTNQGPFVGDPDIPGKRVCGYRKGGDLLVNPNAQPKAQYTYTTQRVRDCLKRRASVDAKRYAV